MAWVSQREAMKIEDLPVPFYVDNCCELSSVTGLLNKSTCWAWTREHRAKRALEVDS
jgi:hypothetical protein